MFKNILNFKNTFYVRQFINYRKLSLDSIQIKKEPKPNIYEYLKMRIKATGPITVADYMRIILTNADSGYYCAKKNIIGPDGDFTTSPEICQLFSEMIGVWMIHEWQKVGGCKPLQIVELGPGNGTLIADVIKVFKDLKMLQDINIELVEMNPHLAQKQVESLECDLIEETKSNNPENPYMKGIYQGNIPVNWRHRLQDVPRGFSIILANEFFDAFPIHKFQKTKDGWREILIDIDPESKEEKEKFRMVLSKYETPYSKLFIKANELRDKLEISPESGSLIENISSRLEEDGGFALIVDYGHDGTKTDTFRAFRNHQLHDPLVDPGSADLTADVDFAFFRDLAKNKMLTYGPIKQREFLLNIGIKQRLEIIKSQCKTLDQNHLEESFKMITDDDKMGGSFHFFALFPEVLKDHLMKYPPAGFIPLE